jgi:ribosomal protein L44E
MPNRQLSASELENLARPLLSQVRARLTELANGNSELHWALRRKLYKELIYDERGKPMLRRALKQLKRKEQGDLCAICETQLPTKGAILDRLEAMAGYTQANTRLLCPQCDTQVQTERAYK